MSKKAKQKKPKKPPKKTKNTKTTTPNKQKKPTLMKYGGLRNKVRKCHQQNCLGVLEEWSKMI